MAWENVVRAKFLWQATWWSIATQTTVTAAATITLGDTHNILICSAICTVTLPTAVGITGRQYNIINSWTATVTIDPYSTQTISGDTTLDLTSQWDSVVIVSDGTNRIRCS